MTFFCYFCFLPLTRYQFSTILIISLNTVWIDSIGYGTHSFKVNKVFTITLFRSMGVVALMYKIVPRSRYNWRFSSDVKAMEQIITRFDRAAHIPGFKKKTTTTVQLQATWPFSIQMGYTSLYQGMIFSSSASGQQWPLVLGYWRHHLGLWALPWRQF